MWLYGSNVSEPLRLFLGPDGKNLLLHVTLTEENVLPL